LTNVTREAGIDFVQDNGRDSGEMFYVEILMAGVVFFDADRDGDPDLYFLNGRPLAGEIPDPVPTNRFYANDGTGFFEDATETSGLGDARYSSGACAGDYDNDGDLDLYVTNFDVANALYENNGEGQFVDVAERAGVEGEPNTPSSSAFADLDNDGWLDLYTGNCLDHSVSNNKPCKVPKGSDGMRRVYCGPLAFEASTDSLFRNRGDGTFEDITQSSGIGQSSGRTLGVAIADYDDDGDQDIFVACDRSANLLYENLGGASFREVGALSGASLGESGTVQAGMGIVSGDYNGDLRLDVCVTYYAREWNALYRNTGGLRFRDSARKARTLAASRPLMGWGTELFDVDLDGDQDWMVVNGHINPFIGQGGRETYGQVNLLYENLGDGTFRSLGTRAGRALEADNVSRGLALADIDGDGDLDAVVGNMHGRPELLRNDTPRNGRHWLMVRTVGTISNRDGIGARVRVELVEGTQIREVRSGQSYLSHSDLSVHFGLGYEDVVPLLEIRWPSGAKSVLRNVQADRHIEVVEPSEISSSPERN